MDRRDVSQSKYSDAPEYFDQYLQRIYSEYGSLRDWIRRVECPINLEAASRRCAKSYMTAERILRNALLYGEFFDNQPHCVGIKISYDEMMGFGGDDDKRL